MNDMEFDAGQVEQTRRHLQHALDTAPSLSDDGAAATLAGDTTAVHPDVSAALSGFFTATRAVLLANNHELNSTHSTLAQITSSYQDAEADVHTSITGVDRD